MKYEKLSLREMKALAAMHTSENKPIPAALTAAIDAKKEDKDKMCDDDDPDDDGDGNEDDDNDGDGKPAKKPKNTKKAKKADDDPDAKKAANDFPSVSALVPEGEFFAVEALNEGIWITKGHLQAIEGKLAGADAAIRGAQTKTAQAESRAVTAESKANKLAKENKTLKALDGTSTITPGATEDREIEANEYESLAKAETIWDKELKAAAALRGGTKKR
jgi:hypothetical protein